jgi:uncharacterized coiled-coil protein SlyX
MKTKTNIIYTAFPVFAFACLALIQNAQAVSPAPDGGYPGGNTAEGQSALLSRITGGFNTAVGFFSLRSDMTGSFNTAIGAGALLANTADNNTAIGTGALFSSTTGLANTANGAFAVFSNTTGTSNTGSGYQALFSNQTGGNNTACGYLALDINTAGNNNTALGAYALAANSGSNNVAIGYFAGQALTFGSNNIAIGSDGGSGESGTIRIGKNSDQTTTYIAGIAGQTVGMGGSTCYVDNAGKLGVFLSARRFKRDIADMAAASEALLALRPVTFHYKPELDKTGIPQFGLVAEEVAKVNPDLVTHDAKGDIYTVRYEAVNVMLLNEFLKEHRKVGRLDCKTQEQEATITELKSSVAKQEATISQLKKEMETVVTRLEEHDSKIQRVRDQVQMNRPDAGVVVSNH